MLRDAYEHALRGLQSNSEVAGILIGRFLRDRARDVDFIEIVNVLEACGGASGPVDVSIPVKEWYRLEQEVEEAPKYRGKWMIVGWYHSHPRMNAFMSDVDRDTQARHFHHRGQVALVIGLGRGAPEVKCFDHNGEQCRLYFFPKEGDGDLIPASLVGIEDAITRELYRGFANVQDWIREVQRLRAEVSLLKARLEEQERADEVQQADAQPGETLELGREQAMEDNQEDVLSGLKTRVLQDEPTHVLEEQAESLAERVKLPPVWNAILNRVFCDFQWRNQSLWQQFPTPRRAFYRDRYYYEIGIGFGFSEEPKDRDDRFPLLQENAGLQLISINTACSDGVYLRHTIEKISAALKRALRRMTDGTYAKPEREERYERISLGISECDRMQEELPQEVVGLLPKRDLGEKGVQNTDL